MPSSEPKEATPESGPSCALGDQMKLHRWWLALVAALLTPWIGPHLDRYLPLGLVLLQSGAEDPDAGFWMMAGILLVLGYVVWWAVLTAIAAGLTHRRRGRASGPAD